MRWRHARRWPGLPIPRASGTPRSLPGCSWPRRMRRRPGKPGRCRPRRWTGRSRPGRRRHPRRVPRPGCSACLWRRRRRPRTWRGSSGAAGEDRRTARAVPRPRPCGQQQAAGRWPPQRWAQGCRTWGCRRRLFGDGVSAVCRAFWTPSRLLGARFRRTRRRGRAPDTPARRRRLPRRRRSLGSERVTGRHP